MKPIRSGKPGKSTPTIADTASGHVGSSSGANPSGGSKGRVAETAGAAATTNVRARGVAQATPSTSGPTKPSRIPKLTPESSSNLSAGASASALADELAVEAGVANSSILSNSTPLTDTQSLAQQIADDAAQAAADLEINNEAVETAAKYGLTKDEAVAIRLYTHAQYFRGINALFRQLPADISHADTPGKLMEIGAGSPAIAKLAANIVRGMLKLPPAQDDPVFTPGLGRAVNLRHDLDSYQLNRIINAPTLLSATLSTEELTHDLWWHTKGQVLVIRQKNKGCGKNISAFSIYKNEQEICFLPNTKFRVTYRSKPTSVPPGFIHEMNGKLPVPAPDADNLHPNKVFIVLEEM